MTMHASLRVSSPACAIGTIRTACRRMRFAGAFFAIGLLAGCVTEQALNPAAPPVFGNGHNQVLLMPIDVQLYELNVSGIEEPRADWTEAARSHVQSAIDAENAARNLQLIRFDPDTAPAELQSEIHQIVKLHEAVGASMLQHRYGFPKLPTKTSEFDWSMGEEVRLLQDMTGADYALFVYLKDSYATGGRKAMMFFENVIAGLLGIGVGPPIGGTQIGYATLVDLTTGQVAWFGSLARHTGDLRTADAAAGSIADLFSGLPES